MKPLLESGSTSAYATRAFFFVVTLVVVDVGGYILVIHLSHMLTLCAEILVWDFVYTLTLHAVENSFS